MIKKIFCFCLMSFALFTAVSNAATHRAMTCPMAVSTSDPAFCGGTNVPQSFQSVASCHCTEGGLDGGICSDMSTIYSAMTDMFGSMNSACAFQTDTPASVCVDEWNTWCSRCGRCY